MPWTSSLNLQFAYESSGMPTREVVANIFDRHDFAFRWSFAEMAPTVTGLGYDWAIEQTGKLLSELIALAGSRSNQTSRFSNAGLRMVRSIYVMLGSADSLDYRLPASIAS